VHAQGIAMIFSYPQLQDYILFYRLFFRPASLWNFS